MVARTARRTVHLGSRWQVPAIIASVIILAGSALIVDGRTLVQLRDVIQQYTGITISIDDPDFIMGGPKDPARWVDDEPDEVQGIDDKIYAPHSYDLDGTPKTVTGG